MVGKRAFASAVGLCMVKRPAGEWSRPVHAEEGVQQRQIQYGTVL